MTTKMHRLLVHQAGTILAQLHQLTKNFIPDGYKYNGFKTDGITLWRDTDWHLGVLKGYLEIIKQREVSDKGHIYLLNIASELQRDITELGSYFEKPFDQFPRLVIHGDYAPHNLLFYGKQLISILDFGDACLNLRAIDVARGLTTLSRNIPAYTGRFHLDSSLAKAFLQAYQDQQPGQLLSVEEIKSVPDLIRWRLIQPFIWRLNRSLARSEVSIFNYSALKSKMKQARWLKDNRRDLQAFLATLI